MNKELYPRVIEIVSGALIENDEGQILLTQSTKWGDKWVLPGGHVEPGETHFQASVREGEEETGLKLEAVAIVHSGELIGSTDFHRPAHFIFSEVHCKVIGGELRLDEKELTTYKWLFPTEALEFDLAESYQDTLEAYIAYRKAE